MSTAVYPRWCSTETGFRKEKIHYNIEIIIYILLLQLNLNNSSHYLTMIYV